MEPLMTIDDIASMWRCSRRHARDVIVKLPGFPTTAPGSGAKHRVWLRKEVRDFAYRRPAQIPQEAREAA